MVSGRRKSILDDYQPGSRICPLMILGVLSYILSTCTHTAPRDSLQLTRLGLRLQRSGSCCPSRESSRCGSERHLTSPEFSFQVPRTNIPWLQANHIPPRTAGWQPGRGSTGAVFRSARKRDWPSRRASTYMVHFSKPSQLVQESLVKSSCCSTPLPT